VISPPPPKATEGSVMKSDGIYPPAVIPAKAGIV